MTDREDVSDAEVMAALSRMVAQLRAAHEAEAIAAVERGLAESPVAPPLPSPYLAHPALDAYAAFVRQQMTHGEHYIWLPGPRKPPYRFLTESEPDPSVMVSNNVVLDVRQYFGPAPYVGGEFIYTWKAAVDKHHRWIGGDEVRVVRR